MHVTIVVGGGRVRGGGYVRGTEEEEVVGSGEVEM